MEWGVKPQNLTAVQGSPAFARRRGKRSKTLFIVMSVRKPTADGIQRPRGFGLSSDIAAIAQDDQLDDEIVVRREIEEQVGLTNHAYQNFDRYRR
jgi:hypothetical protein